MLPRRVRSLLVLAVPSVLPVPFVLAALLALGAPAALAAAPQQKTAPPGVYRMMLGDIEVTTLSDGTVALPFTEILQKIPKAKTEAMLARQFLKEPVETSVNVFLVNTGTKLVMIDAGAGTFFGPTLGRTLTALKASGYQPEQVDEIYISHMHGDHIGGLLADGKPAFPNAVVRAEQAEAAFWLSQAAMDAAPEARRDAFKGAMAAINPYASAGRFKPYAGDTELVPGVRAVVARGHTPGHAMYVIESKGEKLVLWGDLMHQAAVQFPDPSVTVTFDSDQGEAAKQRRRAYQAAAREGHWVGASHLPFPGLGHLRAEGKGYTFVPANYVALPAAK
jgi:glyoxylase-like metal-dependent hydrolase (beta-lactamase superfamily II)